MSYPPRYSNQPYSPPKYSQNEYDDDSISYSPKPRDRDRHLDRAPERPWMNPRDEWKDMYSPRRDDSHQYPSRDEYSSFSPRREYRRDSMFPRQRIMYRRREDEIEEEIAEKYFEENKSQEWFIKQFNPIDLRERRLAKQKRVQEMYDKFMTKIEFPDYGNELALPNDPYDGRRVMIIGDRMATSERVKQISPLKDEIEKVVVGDPRYRKSQIGFLIYKTKEAAQEARKLQQETEKNHIASIRSKEPQLRYAPKNFSEIQRLERDIEKLKSLITLMDGLNGVVGNKLWELAEWDNWNVREKVDVQITYLRKVHSLCYYCLIEYSDEEELYRRCTFHYREKLDGNDESRLPPKTVHWFKNFDQYENSFCLSLKEEDKHLATECQKRIIAKIYDENMVCSECHKTIIEDPVRHATICHASKLNPEDIDEIASTYKKNFLHDPKKKALPNY